MPALKNLLPLLIGVAVASGHAAAQAAPAATPPAGTDMAFLQSSRSLTLKDLGQIYPLKLRTVFGQASIPLNLRADQVVTGASLELRYAHSPSLRFDLSHLSVYLNDQLLRTLPLTAESASGASVRIAIDPRLLLPHNQIRFELVAHYAKPNECEDPAHSTLWADIDNGSRIDLTMSPLPPPPDLANLPAPLFDAGDERRLRLPFAFAGTANPGTLKAAAIVAAWFGTQADYRGADFPVSFNALPPGEGVVLVSGAAALPGFERFAGRQTPGVAVIDNPNAPGSQLLVLSAPDSAGLVQAAQALALGKLTLQGPSAEVSTLELPPPREAWSSSRWVRADRPFMLADGAVAPLSVTGLVPGPIGFEFSLPPDLFPLSKESVRAHLKYRAAPVSAFNSSLNALLNGQFVGGVALDHSSAGKRKVEDSSTLDLVLPVDALRAHNRLDAQYHFRRDTNLPCQDFDSTSLQGSIEPASTLEIRRYAHFAVMPALQKFADGAYPFSRYGDLADTAIVLPQAPTETDVSAALIAAGHIGRWTRDAATRIEVTTTDALDAVADRELLLVGRLDMLGLPDEWTQRMPLRLSGERVELAPLGLFTELSDRWLQDRDVSAAREHASRVIVDAAQGFAAIEGFESPLKSGRSVVLLTAGRNGDVRSAALALTDPGDVQFVRGGLTLVQGSKVSGYDLGSDYEVGHLPWWFAIQRWLALHPYLIWPIALLLVIIVGILVQTLLRRRAKLRLEHKI
ncbi:cellulose biosynthesis cyclic di-GMP-binding regulatory protein BcsB [Solimonas soli]|uniref:cellulose biosynthesis cyclic di-GMP-binding regulatory protein BcsB n=1 Tax=Solimonas soli TaxID=413479 RepID=UPI0004B22FAC|nr:cellulose biosynthesis cyclic di-GMP-binding regulatory protein BcsB [Solimonas soli]